MTLYVDADTFTAGDSFDSNKVYTRQSNEAALDKFYLPTNETTTIFLGGNADNFAYVFNALAWSKGVNVNMFSSALYSCTDEWGTPTSTDSFVAANDKIEINKNGRLAFGTGNSMPHIYSKESGTVSFPARAPDAQAAEIFTDVAVLATGKLPQTDFVFVQAEYTAPAYLSGYKINFDGTSSPYSVQQGFSGGLELWVAHSLLDFSVNSSGQLIVTNRWFNQSSAGQNIPAINFSYTVYLGLFN